MPCILDKCLILEELYFKVIKFSVESILIIWYMFPANKMLCAYNKYHNHVYSSSFLEIFIPRYENKHSACFFQWPYESELFKVLMQHIDEGKRIFIKGNINSNKYYYLIYLFSQNERILLQDTPLLKDTSKDNKIQISKAKQNALSEDKIFTWWDTVLKVVNTYLVQYLYQVQN